MPRIAVVFALIFERKLSQNIQIVYCSYCSILRPKKPRSTGEELVSVESSWVVAVALWYNLDWYDVSGKTLQQVLREQIFTKYGKSTEIQYIQSTVLNVHKTFKCHTELNGDRILSMSKRMLIP